MKFATGGATTCGDVACEAKAVVYRERAEREAAWKRRPAGAERVVSLAQASALRAVAAPAPANPALPKPSRRKQRETPARTRGPRLTKAPSGFWEFD